MNLSVVCLPFFGIYTGSCCIGHLLPDALVRRVSEDTGVEAARLVKPALLS